MKGLSRTPETVMRRLRHVTADFGKRVWVGDSVSHLEDRQPEDNPPSSEAMKEKKSRRVYLCPYCGQGGLKIVEIKTPSGIEAVVCSECDRIWVAPNKIGFHNGEQLDDVLAEHGLTGLWHPLDRIRAGAPLDRIGPDYLAILERNFPNDIVEG
jgi:hypothetical protein